ncbi:MAG: hypothetical protein AB7Q97_15190 [Gammaproteobacteria bacterium]
MGCESANDDASGARYAVAFRERLFGVNCDVEVTVDLHTRAAKATLAMRQMFGARPAFTIGRDDLAALSENLQHLKARAALLQALPEGGVDQQLIFSRGGADLILFQPPGRPARFNLSIGLFHRQGTLDELSAGEIDEALGRLDRRIAEVKARVDNG